MKNKKIDDCIELIFRYGQIDGDHHKLWLIDQLLKKLSGKEYNKIIKEYENDGEYIWDTGCPP